jgi:hypothetical protein
MRTAVLAGCVLALAVARVGAQCPGDLNGDGAVSIDEIVTAVKNSLLGCPAPGRRFVDNGDGTVTDSQNGLMWEKLSFDLTVHGVQNMYTWFSASTTKIAALNSGRFAGYSDWRLPTIYELQSLIDYDQSNPATNAAFNNACVVNCRVATCSCTDIFHGPYWSSTDYAFNPSLAWGVVFGAGGGFVGPTEKTVFGDVRAVRNGS